MKILADFHHHDLFEALTIVFVDRFGWELYRPIGMEWFYQGYWNFERQWHGDKVARQYLGRWDQDVNLGDRWERPDPSHPGRTYRMLDIAQARALRPDIVISTVDHNHEGMAGFAREVGARFGIQLGNIRFGTELDRWDLADFALISTRMPFRPPVPHVFHHQEFSLEAFRTGPPPRGDPFRVSSFVNCFAENAPMYATFRETAARMPEYRWSVFGAYGSAPEDEYAAGNIGVCPDVAAAMRGSDVIWHAKKWSDGFGHVVHNAFAVGRPVFGYFDYYRDQLAGPLFVDGVTAFDIGIRPLREIHRELARLAADEDHHLRVCEAAAARFREVVDFDAEAEAIRRLLE